MPVNLTTKQIQLVWANANATHVRQQVRAAYYAGTQAILEASETRADGSKRTRGVTNWIRKAADDHASFALGNPPNYTISDPDPREDDPESIAKTEAQRQALAQFEIVRRASTIDALEIEHFRSAVLMGYSVEVHGYDPVARLPILTRYDPRSWAFVFDDTGRLRAAIHRTTIPAGTFRADGVIEADIVEWTVYDDATVRKFTETEQKSEGGGGSGKSESALTELSSTPHFYGMVPVIVFRVLESYEPFVSDALITLQDAYNEAHSDLRDDVKNNVDAVLAITGYEPGALYEKDSAGLTYVDKLRADKLLTLREGASAQFLTKGNQQDKVEYDLNVTRDDIHLEASLADISRIVGATGTVSGIALKLKLKPMIAQASIFLKWFEEGQRRRVNLLNALWAKLGGQQLTDYLINHNEDIPINESESYQDIANVSSVLSRADTIKVAIPSIKDPEQAAQRKRTEEDQLIDSARFPGSESEDADDDPPPDDDETTESSGDAGNRAA